MTFHIPLVRYISVFANLVLHEYRSIRVTILHDDSDISTEIENVMLQVLSPLANTFIPEKEGTNTNSGPTHNGSCKHIVMRASATLRIAARLALQAIAGNFQVKAGLWGPMGRQVRIAADMYSNRKDYYDKLDPDLFMLQV